VGLDLSLQAFELPAIQFDCGDGNIHFLHHNRGQDHSQDHGHGVNSKYDHHQHHVNFGEQAIVFYKVCRSKSMTHAQTE
jgi:hypothetical protein